MKRTGSIILAVVMALTAVPLSAFAAEKRAPLQVGIMSDIHYFSAELTGNYCEAFMKYAAINTRQEAQSEALLESALYAIAKHARQNAMKYLLIAGDSTRDGEYAGHQKFAARLERFEKETGIQVIVTNGNHDINNAGAATFENGKKENARRTSPEDWLSLYKNLGFDLAYHTFKPSGGKKGGMLSYSVRLDGGYRLIVMDSCKYSRDSTSDGEDQHEGEGVFSDELMAWILAEAVDARACGEEIIGMTHHSLLPHFDIEPTVMPTLTLDNWLVAGEALATAGMRYVFTGHIHMNDTATGTADNGEVITDISTASLSGYPNTFKEVLFDHSSTGFSADLNTYDADCEKPVVWGDVRYAQPYRDTFSFGQSFGHNGLGQFGAEMVNQVVSEYLAKAKQQGFIGMLKSLGIDIGGVLNGLIGKGISAGNLNIFTSKNVMGLINDLAEQIENNYVNNPERVKAIIEKAIVKLASYKVSDIPCTKFIKSPGFGDINKGGSFEDFGQSLIVYMFSGNEDLSDDAFMSDVLKKIEHGDFADRLTDVLVQIILDDLLKNELLSTFKINISPVFTYKLTRETLGAFLDFAVRAMLGGDASYSSLIDFMFKLGFISQKKAEKLIDGALDIYIDESGVDETLAFWVRSLITDSNPGLKMDSKVKLNYTGPVAVVPSQKDFRLPAEISAAAVNNGNKSATQKITWYTKYSVTGTDIEIIPYSKNPVFSGVPATGAGIAVKTENLNRTFHALKLTGLELFPYKLSQVYHTVEVSNLAPGRKYLYRVGDAVKGWWSSAQILCTSFPVSEFANISVVRQQAKEITACLPAVFKAMKLLVSLSILP